VAEQRHVTGTLEARLFALFADLAADRAAIGALHGSGRFAVLPSPDRHVLCFTRSHPAHGRFTMVANFGHATAVVRLADVCAGESVVARSAGASVSSEGIAQLAANGYLWLTIA